MNLTDKKFPENKISNISKIELVPEAFDAARHQKIMKIFNEFKTNLLWRYIMKIPKSNMLTISESCCKKLFDIKQVQLLGLIVIYFAHRGLD